MNFRATLAVFFGGLIGGVLRFAVSNVVFAHSESIPWGTWIVNLLGSFALAITVILIERIGTKDWQRHGVTIGLIGGFTTFSTFTEQLITLAQSAPAMALLYASISILGGVLGALSGELLGRGLVNRWDGKSPLSFATVTQLEFEGVDLKEGDS